MSIRHRVKILLLGMVLSVVVPFRVRGHGALVIPATRNAVETLQNASTYPAGDGACPCANGAIPGTSGVGLARGCANANACYWFSQGCTIGCKHCDGTPTKQKDLCGLGFNYTISDPTKRTFNRATTAGTDKDWTRYHPWRAPGSAPILNPCGVAGGTHNGDYNTDGAMYPGDWDSGASHRGPITPYAALGDLGSSLPKGPVTTWTSGAEVEVAWTIEFNHGGGYQYRLCPASELMTEDCFQKHPMPFIAGTAKLRFANKSVVTINGTYVSEGTMPAGRVWAMNPIPARGRDPEHKVQIEFAPPCDESGVKGTCSGDTARWPAHLGLQIVDTLSVPAELPHGDYVMQWRWDCEGSAQVWTNCADITIIGN